MRRLLVWLRRGLRAPWLLWRVARIKRERAAALERQRALEAEIEAVRAARARTLAKIAGYESAVAAAALNAEIAAAERLPAGFRGQT